jgi:hypothetical protein
VSLVETRLQQAVQSVCDGPSPSERVLGEQKW